LVNQKAIKKSKSIFKDAFDTLDDFFKEKRSDTVVEKIKKAQREEVALCKFKKSLGGKTNQINFRILIGSKRNQVTLSTKQYIRKIKKSLSYMFMM